MPDALYNVAARKSDADWVEEIVVENGALAVGEKTQYRSSGNLRDAIIAYFLANNEVVTSVTNVTEITNPVDNQFTFINNEGNIQIGIYDETTEEWTIYNLIPITYEIDVGATNNQQTFVIDTNDIGGLTDLNNARNIALFTDYGRRPSSDWSIDGTNKLQINSTDPQGGGWDTNSLYFLIEH